MSDPVCGNLGGPFSTPTKYEVPIIDGFIGVPRPSLAAPGWGEPYKTPEGVPITPGTPGGANAAATLMKKKKEGATWKIRRAKRIQKYGEISWRGPKKTEKEDAKRYILTYHGPASRHFPTVFAYGSDSKHKNVYMEGGLMGIAPGPVLGACLQTISGKRYLLVVCLADEGEIVLRRPAGAPVYGGDEDKMKELADFATEKKPNGWVRAGTVTISEYDRPQTPWFFNESGTEGQCIRVKEKDGTFNGDVKKEKAGDRFKLQTAGVSISTIAMGNLPAYKFKEWGKLTNNGMWLSPPDTQGYPHKWEEMNLNVNATVSGKQVVAVDYEGDKEILVYAVVDVDYRMNQDYMMGKDGDLYEGIPLGDPPGYRNWINNPVGYRYMNPLKLGVEPTATVGNHQGFMWFGGYAWTYLSFTLDGVEYRVSIEAAGTQTLEEYNDLPRNPENSNIFYRYYEIQYVRHLDVRAGGMIVTRLDKFEEFPYDEQASMSKEETVDDDFSDNKVWAYIEGDKEWQQEFYPLYHPRLNRTQDFKSEYADEYTIDATWEIVHGEGRPGTPGWTQDPWEWEATTWIGARPDNNDTATIGNLPINSWFPKQSDTYRKSWYGLKLLRHELNQETASFCRREDKTYILSGELPHPNTGEPKAFIETKPDDLKDKIDGPVYYPIGEL